MSSESKPQKHKQEFEEYLARVERDVGEIAPGQYVKWSGQLVKLLGYDEFEERYSKYLEIRQAYDDILKQGDTVNDAVVQLLNEHAAHLLLKV